MVFSEIFLFASFGNCRFLNFGNITVISVLSEHFRTRKNRENRENSRFFAIFVFTSFGNCRFPKIRVGTSFRAFSELVPTRKNSFRLKTRLESSECRALILAGYSDLFLKMLINKLFVISELCSHYLINQISKPQFAKKMDLHPYKNTGRLNLLGETLVSNIKGSNLFIVYIYPFIHTHHAIICFFIYTKSNIATNKLS